LNLIDFLPHIFGFLSVDRKTILLIMSSIYHNLLSQQPLSNHVTNHSQNDSNDQKVIPAERQLDSFLTYFRISIISSEKDQDLKGTLDTKSVLSIDSSEKDQDLKENG
jgi:hypothetical protein